MHVSTSVGWIGAVTCFVALAIAGATSRRSETVQAAYLAMELICWSVIVPLSVASPVFGVMQALGTPWGLLRHYWIVVKLLVTVFCTAVLLLHMLPTTELANAAAQGKLAAGAEQDLRVQLIADSIVAFVALLFTMVLSIYKPVGLTARGYAAARSSLDGQPPVRLTPAWVVWLRRLALVTAVVFLVAHLAGKGIGGHGLHGLHAAPVHIASAASTR